MGQWLFRIETLRDDNSSPSLKDALKRFGAMHWGAVALIVIFVIMNYGLGITNISINNDGVTSPGNQVAQLIILLAMVAVLIVWLGGALMAAIHPRKRSAHDLLTNTKVTYRVDEID